MGFQLKILEGPEQGKTFAFDRIEITIGRTMENDIVLPDPGISRQHISIRDKGGAYIIKDLGSSNGTKLNGQPIREEVIKPGDVIMMGAAQVRFDVPAGQASGGQSNPARPKRATGRRARPRAGRPGANERGSQARRKPRPKRTPRRRAGDRNPARQQRSGGRAQAQAKKPVIQSPGIRQKEPPAPEKAKANGETGRHPARSPGIKGAVQKFSIWFRSLPKRMRIMFVSLVGILLVLVIVLLARTGQKVYETQFDHSGDEFYAGERDARGELVSYGYGPVSIQCRTRATFLFKHTNGRETVTYSVAGVDSKPEVEMQLNGIQLGFASITLDKWSSYLRMTLPRKHLLENEENRLTFVNTVNSRDSNADDSWAVVVASIEETPLPQPDKVAAAENFHLAKDLYQRRDVAPPNLYKALQHYRRARDFLELLPESSRPDIYLEANAMVERLERELDTRIRNIFFTAARHHKFRRYDEAKQAYHLIMRVLSNPEDPRYQDAKRKHDKYR